MNFLIKKNKICSFNHDKFWASLDTQKDKRYFNDLWKNKNLLGIKLLIQNCCCN